MIQDHYLKFAREAAIAMIGNYSRPVPPEKLAEIAKTSFDLADAMDKEVGEREVERIAAATRFSMGANKKREERELLMSGWISVKDRLPTSDETVKIVTSNGSGWGCYCPSNNKWMVMDYGMIIKRIEPVSPITHWKPL